MFSKQTQSEVGFPSLQDPKENGRVGGGKGRDGEAGRLLSLSGLHSERQGEPRVQVLAHLPDGSLRAD